MIIMLGGSPDYIQGFFDALDAYPQMVYHPFDCECPYGRGLKDGYEAAQQIASELTGPLSMGPHRN